MSKVRNVRPKREKKFTTKMQASLLVFFCIIMLFIVGLIIRLVVLNQKDGERYAKKVLSQQTYSNNVIPYKRGDILDSNGTVLATSVKVYNLVIDIKYLLQFKDSIEPTISALVEYFDIEESTLREYIETKPNSQYQVLLKEIDAELVETFEAYMKEYNKENKKENKSIKGVIFEEEYKRIYPNNNLASSVIGFTVSGNVGNWGIEQYYNEELNGVNGRTYGYIDSELNLDQVVKKAEDGNTIVSTIDLNVQRIVQQHIDQFNEEIGSKNLGVIVMNPNNGEIIAMASNKEYDLNNPRDLSGYYTDEEIAAMDDEEKINALNSIWRNYTISNIFEPGSTFKPITIAAALEEAMISNETEFLCDGGLYYAPGKRIACNKTHGYVTLAEAMMYSCNDALMQIGELLGPKLFYNYETNFLIGQKTGIDLPGEELGLLVKAENLGLTQLATSSFGQTTEVTMIQLAAAYSSIVNGGYYYEPRVVKQIVNSSGGVVEKKDAVLVRETVSEETSELINQYLYYTVEEGTAKPAQVEGYAIGGKTGTAQKFPRADRKFIVSFIGSVPADDPEVVVYVIIDEPNVENQADSTIATKFASKLMAEILPFLKIYPEGDIDYSIFPNINPQDSKEDENQNDEDSEGTDGEEDPYKDIVNDPMNDEFNGEAIPSDLDDDLGDNSSTGDDEGSGNTEEDTSDQSDNDSSDNGE